MLPFPSPGDLTDQGVEPRSLTLQADSLPSEPLNIYNCNKGGDGSFFFLIFDFVEKSNDSGIQIKWGISVKSYIYI